MCECERPDIYKSKMVRVRKVHQCVECFENIDRGALAEKVDHLLDGEFETFYTCSDCAEIREYLEDKFPDYGEICHGELFTCCYEMFPVDGRFEKGRSCTISFTPWLRMINRKFRLVAEHVYH